MWSGLIGGVVAAVVLLRPLPATGLGAGVAWGVERERLWRGSERGTAAGCNCRGRGR